MGQSLSTVDWDVFGWNWMMLILSNTVEIPYTKEFHAHSAGLHVREATLWPKCVSDSFRFYPSRELLGPSTCYKECCYCVLPGNRVTHCCGQRHGGSASFGFLQENCRNPGFEEASWSVEYNCYKKCARVLKIAKLRLFWQTAFNFYP